MRPRRGQGPADGAGVGIFREHVDSVRLKSLEFEQALLTCGGHGDTPRRLVIAGPPDGRAFRDLRALPRSGPDHVGVVLDVPGDEPAGGGYCIGRLRELVVSNLDQPVLRRPNGKRALVDQCYSFR